MGIFDNNNLQTSVKIAGVRLFPAGFRFGPHKHKEVEVIYVETGLCIIRLEDENRTVNICENEGLIIYPDVNHTFIIDESSKCRITQIQFVILEYNKESDLSSLPFFIHMVSGIKCEKIFHCSDIKGCIGRIKQSILDKCLFEIYITELLVLLSHSINNKKSEYLHIKNEKIKSIIEYTNQNIFEPIVIEDVCKEFDVSSRYLRKKFLEATGYNVNYYITLQRINHAKELLADRSLSVTQISYQTGFSSSQYFNRVFKTVTGQTPTQYKTQHYRSKEIF